MSLTKRIAGSIYHPNGKVQHFIEPVRDTKGFGRWIYCKYCYRNVLPQLSGLNQIVCSECGYGLTPDFFSLESLKIYHRTGDYDLARQNDDGSKEKIDWENTFIGGKQG